VTYNNLVNKSRAWREKWDREPRDYTVGDAESFLDELTRAYLAEKSEAGSRHLKVEIDLWEMLL
jgi:hypothetical protein